MTALDDLLAVVTLEPNGSDTFTGIGSANDGVEATFGGHFLAQATAAVSATVDEGRLIHSLHGYFLRGGQPGRPYLLEVERTRDGRSFCTRRVRIAQDGLPSEGAKVQFELTASFTVDADGPTFDAPSPVDFDSVPDPLSLPTYRELMTSHDVLPLPEDWAMRDYGLDIRTVNAPWAPDGPSEHGGIRLWVKADGTLPDDPNLHAAILAYQSDESLADTVAMPWGATWGTPGVIFVSLDHAMWFHRRFDLNEWHFLDQRPLTVGNERGLASASVWNSSGTMVATVNQEALLRLE
ncbi:MAG: acyl-CoA thioesterase-2 [Acidimicrobiales bacterium]|jgi:acyl-CoA thioesterase II